MMRKTLYCAVGIALGASACLADKTERRLASADDAAARYAREAIDDAEEPDAPATREARAAARHDAPAPSDAALAAGVDLAMLEAAARERHPILRAGAHRVRELTLAARAERSLPPPEFMTELWQVPIERPYAVDEAGMWMLSLRQHFPAAGRLADEAEATAREAEAAAAMIAADERALVREVGHAFADYVESTARHDAHGAHVALVAQLGGAARARYAVRGELSDVVGADLEQARLEADLAREHGMVEEARARLNGLLARPADAPLGPPKAGAPETVRLSAAEVAARAEERHPEVAAAEAMRGAAAGHVEAADQEAVVPSFTAGLNAFLPVGGMPFGWGASFAMTLPWLWGPQLGRSASLAQRVRARDAAVEVVKTRLGAEAARALAAVKGAERRYLRLRDRARPAAQRAREAAVAGYAAGGTNVLQWLDADRGALDVELDLAMARGDLDRALADLDGAVGERVPRVPIAPPAVADPAPAEPGAAP